MRQKQVLIADDDLESVRVLMFHFKEAGYDYEFLQAPNGQVACRLAKKYLPDLIIMDWEMPVMNGLEAVEELRQNKETRLIPIIIASGAMLEEKHLELALEKGAIDYVRKPLDRNEVLARAHAAMELAEANSRERDLLRELLDQKTRQLSSLALQLAQKNHLLNDLLKEIQEWEKPNATRKRNAIKLIQSNLTLDEDWNRFQMHFEEVHPGFFDYLQRTYPQLTNSDIKLCAYLRMRLENKEIAQLLNISPKGIETARYRLRKRLDLEKPIRLNEFIQGLEY